MANSNWYYLVFCCNVYMLEIRKIYCNRSGHVGAMREQPVDSIKIVHKITELNK